MSKYNNDFEQFCIQVNALYSKFRNQILAIVILYGEFIAFIQFFSKFSGAPSREHMLMLFGICLSIILYVLCLILNHLIIRRFIDKRVIILFEIFLLLTISGIVISNSMGLLFLDTELLNYIKAHGDVEDTYLLELFFGIKPI